MGTTKQFTGRLVHQLDERHYVTTAPDPSDRRATIVKITPDGLRFFADACAAKTEIEDMFKAVAGEENLAMLMGTLQKLASAFSSYERLGSENPLGDDGDGLPQ